MSRQTVTRRLAGHDVLATIGTEEPLVVGREAVCPDCNLVYWIAGGHDCDRITTPRKETA